jgi:lysophospholipase L1-like esterase
MLRVVGAASVALAGLAMPSHAAERTEGRETVRASARVARHYAVLGDSITYGAGTSDPATRAYPVVAGVQGVGIGGACAIVAHCRYPALPDWMGEAIREFDRRPSTVVALIGINDVILGAEVREVITALKRLRRQARTMHVRLVFGTLTPPGRNEPWSYIQEPRNQVNRWIRSQPVFVEYAEAVENRKGWLNPAHDADGLHLNNAGERALARVLVDWVTGDVARRR